MAFSILITRTSLITRSHNARNVTSSKCTNWVHREGMFCSLPPLSYLDVVHSKVNECDAINLSLAKVNISAKTHAHDFAIRSMLRRLWNRTQIYIFGSRSEETFNCCRCHDIINVCNEVKDTDRQLLASAAWNSRDGLAYLIASKHWSSLGISVHRLASKTSSGLESHKHNEP